MTFVFLILQIVSIFQRKGIKIDFNELHASLKEDIENLSGERAKDSKPLLKGMKVFMSVVQVFYLGYFILAYISDLIVVEFFAIMAISLAIDFFIERAFYRTFEKGEMFSTKKNTFFSAITTANNILQISAFIVIITRII